MRTSAKAAILVAAGVLTLRAAAVTGGDPPTVTVHEWGTMTSIAGVDGRAVPWRPLSGPPDLPVFVRHTGVERKGTLTATVRMETPVLYFYAPHETVVDVSVGFRQGFITEYFPRADVAPIGPGPLRATAPGYMHRISWRDVRIRPGAAAGFPDERTPNHYYAARQTDAAPLAVGPDLERFLFYRGVGSFPLPLTALVRDDGEVEVTNVGREIIPAVILFENRGGRIASRALRDLAGRATFAPPLATADIPSVRGQLERLLVNEGLFDREATAMVETWSDTWFEDGMRLFYLLPRRAVDSILPLDIRPAPAGIARVFVGRLELVTTATLTDLREAFESEDIPRLAGYGRFLRPFAERLFAGLPAADRTRFAALLEAASSPGGGPVADR